MSLTPKYPLYIVSKGRWQSRLTSRALHSMGLRHYLVVEEQEYTKYAATIDDSVELLVLDRSYQRDYDTCDNLGDSKSRGPGPARNFAWDHSIAQGYPRHWVMDDNIKMFLRLQYNLKTPVGDGVVLVCMEDFVERYSNVGMAGPNYFMFASRKTEIPPFVLNTRIYSCNLIRNDLPYRWRGRYNEDTDLSIRMLKDGWCTILFNAFLQYKLPTQQLPGGNTEAFYAREGTLPKSKMLRELHPDITEIVWRFGRWHHYVNYSPFKRNGLVRQPNYDQLVSQSEGKYGMRLVHLSPPISEKGGRPSNMKRKKLYTHQREAEKKALALDGRCGQFGEVGTGKTRIAIELAARLLCKRVVVVAPLTALGVWRKQVKEWMSSARTATCSLGSTRRSAAKLRRIRKREADRLVFVLVGYESYWRSPLREEILRYAPEMIIYDEAHRLRNRSTKQSRFAHALASDGNALHTPRYILPLTGTPNPNGPEDFFSIYKAFDPSVFGPRWKDFSDHYLIYGGFGGYKITGHRNLRELERKVADHSYRITKAEALDLPGEVDVEIPVTLSRKSRRIYDDMAKHAIAEIDGVQGSGTALARIVLTNLVRCQQIASGFVRVEEDKQYIHFGTEKRDALADWMEDVILDAKRIVVFCRFRPDVDAAMEVARGIVGESVYMLDGRVTEEREMAAQVKWFETFSPSVLVIQVQKAVSIDLTCAHVGMFYSKDWSLLDFDQCRGRIHRNKQKKKVTFYHLVAQDTVDERIRAALAGKRDLMHEVLDKRRAKELFG